MWYVYPDAQKKTAKNHGTIKYEMKVGMGQWATITMSAANPFKTLNHVILLLLLIDVDIHISFYYIGIIGYYRLLILNEKPNIY